VTCKRCILSNKKFDEQMKKDGVMTEDGRIKTAEEMGFEQNACAILLL
jgi:hypothetical protein